MDSTSSPIVILAPRVTDDSVRIWKAALENGWSVQRLGSWRVPPGLQESHSDFAIYAEPLFAEAVADQLGLILLEPPPEWLVSLPAKFLGRSVRLSTLREARQCLQRTFVKPAEGKVFEARVYDRGTDLPSADVVDESLPVLVSDPVSFLLEVRCFVLEGAVLSMSPYWRNGALAEGPNGDWPFLGGEAVAFANEVLQSSGMQHPPAFVLDIGVTQEAGWAVVEANPCWGAGLYGCAAVDALQTVRRAVRRRSGISGDEIKWTSPRVQGSLGIAPPIAADSP